MEELNIELPREALELAASARDHFPGLTDPEIAIELLKLGLKKNARTQARISMQKARTTLTKMLLALSDEALEYVWRPIVYAYYYTDDRDPDRLSEEDSIRFSLIGAAAHDNPETVAMLNKFHIGLWNTERKRRMS